MDEKDQNPGTTSLKICDGKRMVLSDKFIWQWMEI
jgi:hypothetical protein